MKPMLSLLSSTADKPLHTAGGTASSALSQIRVKLLGERDRRRLLTHFLALGEQDRVQRFGGVHTDDHITRYVQKIDLERDTVFGVFEDLQLVGVGHLAFVAREATPLPRHVTGEARVGELGISVLLEARGKGVGCKLMERAAMHCRMHDINTLFIPCLASNETMLHIARRAGMEVRHIEGEAQAFLSLPTAKPCDVSRHAMIGQFALLDRPAKCSVDTARWRWRRTD